MICFLIIFGHLFTLNSRGLNSYPDLKLSVSANTCFDQSRQKKHNGVRIIVPTFLVQKLFTKIYYRLSDLR